eukprot:6202444-Pleurochrysis_carterae.AAC.1
MQCMANEDSQHDMSRSGDETETCVKRLTQTQTSATITPDLKGTGHFVAAAAARVRELLVALFSLSFFEPLPPAFCLARPSHSAMNAARSVRCASQERSSCHERRFRH